MAGNCVERKEYCLQVPPSVGPAHFVIDTSTPLDIQFLLVTLCAFGVLSSYLNVSKCCKNCIKHVLPKCNYNKRGGDVDVCHVYSFIEHYQLIFIRTML